MIHREDRGSVTVVRMEHGKVNAVDVEFFHALINEFRELKSSSARAIVLTGTGKAFSAGVDLFRVINGGRAYLEAFMPALTEAFALLFTYPKPVVAAVNGHAIAGGCVMTCACDYRIMAEGSGRIGLAELLVGVPFPAMALEIMRFAVPPHHLQRLVYTGRSCPPEVALHYGVIDEMVSAEAMLTRACEVAEQVGAIPPVSFQMTKQELRQPTVDRVERYQQTINREIIDLWASEDLLTAIRTYMEKTVGKK